MTEQERRFILQKLGVQIAEMMHDESYKDIGIFGIIFDGELFHVFGNVCPNCAIETCQYWTKREGLNHPHNGEMREMVKNKSKNNTVN